MDQIPGAAFYNHLHYVYGCYYNVASTEGILFAAIGFNRDFFGGAGAGRIRDSP